ncbi:speckle-type POZ protein-like A [Amblyomma americanum]
MAGCRFSEGPHSFLDSGSHAYITIYVGRGTYSTHKAILASWSPVLNAILSQKTLEVQQGEVFNSDVDYYMFSEFLSFVYTGHSPNLASMADSLLAADKYCLRGIRDMCAETFIERLNVENAVTTHIIADHHNASVLRRCAVDYICARRSEDVGTSGWRSDEKNWLSYISGYTWLNCERFLTFRH